MDRRGSGQSSGVGAASPRKHQSFPTCVTDVLEQVPLSLLLNLYA